MSEKWYLRTQDDTFGPETRERLLEWAKMGRIQPGQEISNDGETWKPAVEIPFLDMRWSIDIGDGTPRGPFNRHAAEALLKSGRLPPGSKLVEVPPAFEVAESAPTPEAAPDPDPSPTVEPERAEQEPEVKVVEKIVKVPVEVIKEVPVEKIVEKEVVKEVPVEKVVEREVRVEVPVEVIKEVPVEKIVEKERIVEVESPELLARAAALEAAVAAAREEGAKALSEAQQERELAITTLRAEGEKALSAAREQHEHELLAARQQGEKALSAAREQHEQELLAARQQGEQALSAARERHEQELLAARQQGEQALSAERAESERTKKALEEAKRETLTLESEIRRLPPNAKEAADTEAAVYWLMRDEADDLERAIAEEKAEAEAAQKRWHARADRLAARRVEILKRIGDDAKDMKSRALRANPMDPRTVQLRQELDALRLVAEKNSYESGQRIKELTRALNEKTTEASRLAVQVTDVKRLQDQIQELREKLQLREKELMAERQASEELRRSTEAAQQSLLKRLSELESGLPGGHTDQSREARAQASRFPSWMQLKK